MLLTLWIHAQWIYMFDIRMGLRMYVRSFCSTHIGVLTGSDMMPSWRTKAPGISPRAFVKTACSFSLFFSSWQLVDVLRSIDDLGSWETDMERANKFLLGHEDGNMSFDPVSLTHWPTDPLLASYSESIKCWTFLGRDCAYSTLGQRGQRKPNT